MNARDEYKSMLLSVEFPWCWYCGRAPEDRPKDWGGPFIVERCHVASIPRILDRRLAILMCSRCHRVQHGERFNRELMIEPPTLSTMLWMKATFDPEYYCRGFIGRFHSGVMPHKRPPPVGVQTIYLNRQGPYPG